MKKLICFGLNLLILFLLSVQTAGAVTILPNCAASGDCKICDFVQLAVNAGMFLIAISGALTMFFIIYGGFTWLISGGSSEKIGKGKAILINSAIGLAITFTAYVIITTFVAVVTNKWDWLGSLSC